MGVLTSGGAFLIPYLLILALLVFPLLTIETTTGQFFRKSIFHIYSRYSKKWTGVTFLVIGVNMLISSYYIYLMGYCFVYLYVTLFEELDWLNLPENKLIFGLKKYFEEHILQSKYDSDAHVK